MITLTNEDMEKLLSKIDDYKRKKITDAESFEKFKYIDPNNNINNISSHNNNIVFGRRGSGKTSLVIAAINKIKQDNKDIYLKYDFQNLRNKKYQKVILEILKETIENIYKETSIFKINVIKNYKLKIKIDNLKIKINKSLELLNHENTTIDLITSKDLNDLSEIEALANLNISHKEDSMEMKANTSAKKNITDKISNKEEIKRQSKDDFIHHTNLEDVQSQLFNTINEFYHIYKKRIILFFDDFYQIKKNIHPHILEYFHTISKKCIQNSFSFKVCALPESIKYNLDGENTFSLKDDYSTINVDHNLDKLNNQTDYLLDILCNLDNDLRINPQDIKNLFVGENLNYCVLGAGGLPRDFMILFSDSVKKAKKNNHDKINAEDVYSAILDLSADKEEKSKLDSEIDSEQIKKSIILIQKEIVDELKTNVILYPITNYEKDIKLLRELENLRYIHSIKDTIRDKNKNTFHPYLIDMSFCVNQKNKKSGMQFNKFWVQDDARTLNNLRKAPTWFFDMDKLK